MLDNEVTQAQFNELKSLVQKLLGEHSEFRAAHHSRRGVQGARGATGEPGISNVPGPAGNQRMARYVSKNLGGNMK